MTSDAIADGVPETASETVEANAPQPPLSPRAIKALRRWLSVDASELPGITQLLEGFCVRLEELGVPVSRAMLSLGTLHPQVLAYTYLWHRTDTLDQGGSTEVSEVDRSELNIANHPDYVRSPIKAIHDGLDEVRVPIWAEKGESPYPVIPELRAQGYTDYVAFALPFSDGVRHVLSFTTAAPGGFSDDQMEFLRESLPVFRLQAEVRAQRRTAAALLDTYVGHEAGERILSGQVTRGEGERIHAVIWYADLRGFTTLSDTLPMDEVITLLDDWFESMTRAIHNHGGQVLKFIGDGLLAIFPLADAAFRHYTVRQALQAAEEAESAIAALNTARAGAEPLNYRLALHVGHLMWGNIGAVDRLDFTAIGPSVNLAARLESLCGDLGINLVMSRDFAEIARDSHAIVSLGPHPLRGVAEPHEVFALADHIGV